MPRGFMDDLEGEVIGEEVHEAVLKTVWGQPHKGSNPFLSANQAPIFGAFLMIKGENNVEFNSSGKCRFSML